MFLSDWCKSHGSTDPWLLPIISTDRDIFPSTLNIYLGYTYRFWSCTKSLLTSTDLKRERILDPIRSVVNKNLLLGYVLRKIFFWGKKMFLSDWCKSHGSTDPWLLPIISTDRDIFPSTLNIYLGYTYRFWSCTKSLLTSTDLKRERILDPIRSAVNKNLLLVFLYHCIKNKNVQNLNNLCHIATHFVGTDLNWVIIE
jgi:hypothetical protein